MIESLMGCGQSSYRTPVILGAVTAERAKGVVFAILLILENIEKCLGLQSIFDRNYQ
jgi:hypothetical protein